MKPFALTLILLALPACAEAPQGFARFSSAQLKSYEKTLPPRINAQKFASEQLGRFGNHSFQVTCRQASGEAEVHEKQDDIFIVQSGAATLVVGGKVVNGKTTAPGEIRGSAIEGGEKHKLGPGDVVNIPAMTPHQVVFDGARQFTYMIIKVDAR
jgi:mannose-6-phosphate isomerase-like protein (cupin superfamily)